MESLRGHTEDLEHLWALVGDVPNGQKYLDEIVREYGSEPKIMELIRQQLPQVLDLFRVEKADHLIEPLLYLASSSPRIHDGKLIGFPFLNASAALAEMRAWEGMPDILRKPVLNFAHGISERARGEDKFLCGPTFIHLEKRDGDDWRWDIDADIQKLRTRGHSDESIKCAYEIVNCNPWFGSVSGVFVNTYHSIIENFPGTMDDALSFLRRLNKYPWICHNFLMLLHYAQLPKNMRHFMDVGLKSLDSIGSAAERHFNPNRWPMSNQFIDEQPHEYETRVNTVLEMCHEINPGPLGTVARKALYSVCIEFIHNPKELWKEFLAQCELLIEKVNDYIDENPDVDPKITGRRGPMYIFGTFAGELGMAGKSLKNRPTYLPDFKQGKRAKNYEWRRLLLERDFLVRGNWKEDPNYHPPRSELRWRYRMSFTSSAHFTRDAKGLVSWDPVDGIPQAIPSDSAQEVADCINLTEAFEAEVEGHLADSQKALAALPGAEASIPFEMRKEMMRELLRELQKKLDELDLRKNAILERAERIQKAPYAKRAFENLSRSKHAVNKTFLEQIKEKVGDPVAKLRRHTGMVAMLSAMRLGLIRDGKSNLGDVMRLVDGAGTDTKVLVALSSFLVGARILEVSGISQRLLPLPGGFNFDGLSALDATDQVRLALTNNKLGRALFENIKRAAPNIVRLIIAHRVRNAGLMPIGTKVHGDTPLNTEPIAAVMDLFGGEFNSNWALREDGHSLALPPRISTFEAKLTLVVLQMMGLVDNVGPDLQWGVAGHWAEPLVRTVGAASLLATDVGIEYAPGAFRPKLDVHREMTKCRIMVRDAGIQASKLEGMPFDIKEAIGRTDRLGSHSLGDADHQQLLGTLAAHAEYGYPLRDLMENLVGPGVNAILRRNGLFDVSRSSSWVYDPDEKSRDPLEGHESMVKAFTSSWFNAAKQPGYGAIGETRSLLARAMQSVRERKSELKAWRPEDFERLFTYA